MDAQSPHFGCFAVLQASIPGTVFLSDVGPGGQLSRRRKVHTKSRLGCTSCKARKVKCDEEQPCRNCIRRNQTCSFNNSPKQTISGTSCRAPIQKPANTLPALPYSELPPINMTHLRLLHHFDACTSGTFVMDSQYWKEAVIKLALQNTFLMHAVFMVTAAHLQHLRPDEKEHQVIALENLSQVLPIFRNAIAAISDSKVYSVDWAEALIACALLLLQYSWTFGSPAWTNLTGFYRGLIGIKLEFIDRIEGGILTPMLSYSPRLRIEHCMQNIAASSQPEAVFAHIVTCTKISDTQPEDPNDFYDPIQRLTTILWALNLDFARQEDSGLLLDAARYLFSLPSLLPGGFIRLLRLEDGRAQIILLYYFAAISRLQSERFWWMRKRAVYMFGEISRNLGDRCEQCTNKAKEIFRDENLD